MLLTPRLSAYLFKIGQKLHRKEYVPALMKCPECGNSVNDSDFSYDAHIIIKQQIGEKILKYVVVGCEGYWTVDPKKLGMKRGNWEPVWEIIKKNLDYYIKEPKTFAEPIDEVIEDNKAEVAAIINMDGRLNYQEKADLLKQLDD